MSACVCLAPSLKSHNAEILAEVPQLVTLLFKSAKPFIMWSHRRICRNRDGGAATNVQTGMGSRLYPKLPNHSPSHVKIVTISMAIYYYFFSDIINAFKSNLVNPGSAILKEKFIVKFELKVSVKGHRKGQDISTTLERSVTNVYRMTKGNFSSRFFRTLQDQ